jgi:hypothetical protein
VSSTKHTPGPWRVKEYRRHSEAVIVNAAGDELATIDLACMPGAVADANLFAAAPDLLEACEAFRAGTECLCCGGFPWCDHDTDKPRHLADAIRAAIKKARGEP